jgi:hypothetical protein
MRPRPYIFTARTLGNAIGLKLSWFEKPGFDLTDFA